MRRTMQMMRRQLRLRSAGTRLEHLEKVITRAANCVGYRAAVTKVRNEVRNTQAAKPPTRRRQCRKTHLQPKQVVQGGSWSALGALGCFCWLLALRVVCEPRCFVCDIRTGFFFCSGILRLARVVRLCWPFMVLRVRRNLGAVVALVAVSWSVGSGASSVEECCLVVLVGWRFRALVMSRLARAMPWPASAEVSLPGVLSSPVLVCGLSPVSTVLQHWSGDLEEVFRQICSCPGAGSVHWSG